MILYIHCNFIYFFFRERNRLNSLSTLFQPFNVLKVYGRKQTHRMKKSTKTRDKQTFVLKTLIDSLNKEVNTI